MAELVARPIVADAPGFPPAAREIIYAAAGIMPEKSPAEIARWFDEAPLDEFGGRTPRGMVADGDAEALLSHLASLEDGVCA